MGISSSSNLCTQKSQKSTAKHLVPTPVSSSSIGKSSNVSDLMEFLEEMHDNSITFKQVSIGQADINVSSAIKHWFIIFGYGRELNTPVKKLEILKYLKYLRIDLYDNGIQFNNGRVSKYFEIDQYYIDYVKLNHKITHTGLFNVNAMDLKTIIESVEDLEYNLLEWNCQHFVKRVLKELEIIIQEITVFIRSKDNKTSNQLIRYYNQQNVRILDVISDIYYNDIRLYLSNDYQIVFLSKNQSNKSTLQKLKTRQEWSNNCQF